MATLQNRLDLADGVSPALERMVRAAELAAAKFQQAGQAANQITRAADFAAAAADMRTVGSEAATAVASITEITIAAGMIPPPIRTAAGAAGGMNNEFRQTTGILSSIKGALSSTFAQFTLANIAAEYITQLVTALSRAPSQLAALSDQYSGIIARLNLVTGSQTQTAELNDQIYYSALRARGGYAEMADAVSKIAMTAKEAFPDARTVVPFMENVQKLFTIGGTDAVRQKDVLLQLTQALGSGKLQGDEFRSIAEAAPMIERVVAEFMGVTQGALKELSSKGEITAEIMKNAILGATNEINAKFNTIPLKWQDIWQNIETRSYHAFVPVFEQISKLANTPGAQKFANTIVNTMQLSAMAILGIINNIEWLSNVISGLYAQYQPEFDGLGAALLYLTGVWATYEAGVIAAAIATGIWATVTGGAAAVGTFIGLMQTIIVLWFECGYATTLAGITASEAWLAILFPIVIVIAAIYLIVAVVNHFAKTSISATGVVVGAFFWLGGMIYNVIVFVWNMFLSFAEFLMNSLKSPVAAQYNLFADIWNGIVELVGRNINEIIGLINKLPGMEIGFVNWGKGLAQKMEIEGAVNLSPYKPDYSSGNFMTGYNKTTELIGKDWIPKFHKIPDIPIPPPIESLAGSSKDTADNTKGMKDAMEITDEDIKYMRDIAEQEVINKYTTAEIKIDMGGVNNNVSSDMDLDGMMRYINDSLIDGIVSGAEAVHS